LGKEVPQGNRKLAPNQKKLGVWQTMLLYRILYLPALLLALPYFLYRMWRRGGYRNGFENRFGILKGVPPRQTGVRRVWIQAVSVGELMAIGPLIRQLREDGKTEIVLTTTTSTGYRLLRDKFAQETIWRGTFPLDFWPCSRKAWQALQPDLAVLMEGELWPEHIHQAWKRGVPVALINARLSDRSFRRHYKVRSLAGSFFSKLSIILCGSETDLKRIRKLAWVADDRVAHSGNLKFDTEEEPGMSHDERALLVNEFGFGNTGGGADEPLILLGSSTWPGEEAALIRSTIALREQYPQLKLLLVPRHAERRKDLEPEIGSFPVRYHFRTDSKQAPEGTEVYVADTTGELKRLTRCADLVFIGKSLPPNSGGQTPIEAAAMGKAIITGPDMSNFRDISRQLVRADAIIRLTDADQLTQAIAKLLASPGERISMGERAGACISVNRGATKFTAAKLKELLSARDQTPS
jgi:3-deoxy-D-manno-octulosonic-acid transferase